MIIISSSIGIGTLYNLEPTLALKLREELSFPTTRIGLYFMVIFFGKTLVAIIAMLIPEKWDKRIIDLFLCIVRCSSDGRSFRTTSSSQLSNLDCSRTVSDRNWHWTSINLHSYRGN